MKTCTKCGGSGPFYKDTRSADGLRYECVSCGYALGKKWRLNNPEKVQKWLNDNKESRATRNANNHLRREYGISLEEKKSMLALQDGVCAICGTDTPGTGKFGRSEWTVDHDHTTNENRGILCQNCNIALGLIKDDPVTAEVMAAYLRGYREAFRD